MNEEQIKAAKAAWQRDPDTAAKALLGMIAEEVFIQAIRGCNQHAHKPGCPDADGDRDPDINENGIDLETGTSERDRINGAKLRFSKANKVLRLIEQELNKDENTQEERKLWVDASNEASAMASNVRSASRYIMENPSGKRMREAWNDSFHTLQKLKNLYFRTALKTKRKASKV